MRASRALRITGWTALSYFLGMHIDYGWLRHYLAQLLGACLFFCEQEVGSQSESCDYRNCLCELISKKHGESPCQGVFFKCELTNGCFSEFESCVNVGSHVILNR
jgi:hypothetical protein